MVFVADLLILKLCGQHGMNRKLFDCLDGRIGPSVMLQVVTRLEAETSVLNDGPSGFLMAAQDDPVRGLILPEFMGRVDPMEELEWFRHKIFSTKMVIAVPDQHRISAKSFSQLVRPNFMSTIGSLLEIAFSRKRNFAVVLPKEIVDLSRPQS